MPDLAVGVKLNSADLQRGGFTESDSEVVVALLETHGSDLLEVSGGTYEATAMWDTQRESTIEREAYFLNCVRSVRDITRLPLMLTGGLRTPQTMENIVAAGHVDAIGLARPLAVTPDLPARILAGEQRITIPRPRPGHGTLATISETPWYVHQMTRLGTGRDPRPRSRLRALADDIKRNALWQLARRRTAKRPPASTTPLRCA